MSARLLIAGVIALLAVAGYFGMPKVVNPVTGTTQRLALSVKDEIVLGMQAAPEMAQQFGGLLPDQQAQDRVDRIGQTLVATVGREAAEYPFDFYVLADRQTVNAFALPGGQVFITAALYDRLQTEGQLAGVLGHEIGHVFGRHAAAQMAKSQLVEGLAAAAAAGTYDPNDPNSRYGAVPAAMAAQMISLRYGRQDELESDVLGVRFMANAGYDPTSLIVVMDILEQAGGGAGGPEWFSSHPNPGNRRERIREAIAQRYPAGVPPGLIP